MVGAAASLATGTDEERVCVGASVGVRVAVGATRVSVAVGGMVEVLDGTGLGVAVAVGRVRVILIPLTVLLLVFPARSWQVPVAERFLPSEVISTVTGENIIPDSASVHFHPTVTGE